MTTTVTWLGHSTVVIDVDGVRLLTDPLLRHRAGLLRRRGRAPSRSRWDAPDAVLLSHLHHDHAELKSLRMLPVGTPVITGAPNVRWLSARHLTAVSPGRDEWVEVGSGTGVQVALCRADHAARPMPHRPNAANGHLVRSGSSTIWVAGDTELFDELEQLPVRAGGTIDLALVPVSGWGARLSGGHMGPVEAAEACRRVGASSAVPVHWGTLHVPGGRRYPRGWMDRPGPDFARALRELAPACRPLVIDVDVPTQVS